MALIYITGPTGAGKTSVRNELLKRGYEAFDTDEGMNSHVNIMTGREVSYPESKDVTPEWLSQHRFIMPRDKVVAMSQFAKERLVFLCGAADNDLELANCFAKTICLHANKNTTKNRVETRTTNNYGRLPAEMESILNNHDIIVEKYRESGAEMLDTTDISLNEVVKKVLEAAEVQPLYHI
jgi:shikimate kinase